MNSGLNEITRMKNPLDLNDLVSSYRNTRHPKPHYSLRMHHHQPARLLNFTRTNSNSNPCSIIQWRTQIKQTQLVSQFSSILLQRHNWVPLLQNLNLASKLTPPLFLQILRKTHTHPQISLSFFNWAKSNLKFKPDLQSQCHIIQVCLQSGISQSAKPIFDSLVQTHPASALGTTMIQTCRGKDSQSNALSFVIEGYSDKGLFREALEVFWKMRKIGCISSVSAGHAVLNALIREGEIKLAWCFYGAMIRDGFLSDKFTWSLIAEILRKDEKFGMIVKLLDMGFYNSAMYNSAVDYFSKCGDFGAAFDRLNEMYKRELKPGFTTYSSILDGVCRNGDIEMIEKVMAMMVDKGFLKESPLSDCDSTIQKVSELGKVNAAMMFFNRARDEKIGLQDATYGYMLRALSKDGRLKEAIGLYRVMLARSITINDSSYHALVDLICKDDKTMEGYDIVVEVVRRGFSPHMSGLSKFITSQCSAGRWGEAEELLNVVLDNDLLPDSSCFCPLVKHYCRSREFDKALMLHNKMEKLQGTMDAGTYDILLDGFVKDGRVDEAVRVFDYLKRRNLATSVSFTTTIRGLCRAKEMRKAMKLHDEMLLMGLKPDRATYKRLILEFKP